MAELILSRNFSVPDAHTLRVYREGGGYKGWDKAKGMEPAAEPQGTEVVEEA